MLAGQRVRVVYEEAVPVVALTSAPMAYNFLTVVFFVHTVPRERYDPSSVTVAQRARIFGYLIPPYMYGCVWVCRRNLVITIQLQSVGTSNGA